MRAMDHEDKLKALHYVQTCDRLGIRGWPVPVFEAIANAMGWTYNNRLPRTRWPP